MATNTYVALDKITTTNAVTSVSFTSIPQGYTDLVVVHSGYGSILFGSNFQFNGDTTTTYSNTVINGNGTTASTSRDSGANYLNAVGLFNTSASNDLGANIAHIMNYSNTTTFKTVLARMGSAGWGTRFNVNLWRSTAAINRIDIITGGAQTFNVGSIFCLYGIAAGGGDTTPKATGGTVTSDATYYYHTFTGSGMFTPLQSLTCDYLVVGGGGGSGWRTNADYYYTGGGGGGGLLTSVGSSGGGGSAGSPLSLTAQAYPVLVGAGGAVPYTNANGVNGNSSSISSVVALGGGGGAVYAATGLAGASGGGAAGDSYTQYYGGAGTSGQGYAGGNMQTGNAYGAGAGGGAGGVGGNAGAVSTGQGGTGGAALANSITGTSVYYSGGGAGGRGYYGSALLGLDGTGYAVDTPNRGMGGRPDTEANASGSSGIVIIRYAK